MKILAIGAHYDDIEIGCGGTLLKYINKGDEVLFAITSSDEFRTGEVKSRYNEQKKSAKIMGIGVGKIFKFSYNQDSVHNIIGKLDSLMVDMVFTQFEFDTHQDHKRASVIGQAVGRKRNITTFFYDSGSGYDFHPNIYSLIDWPKKLEILRCYKSQIDCGALRIDILRKKDAYWASLVTDDINAYAEGFVVRKMIYEV